MTEAGTPRSCSRCGSRPSGPGGILCPECVAEIEAMTTEDWYGAPGD